MSKVIEVEIVGAGAFIAPAGEQRMRPHTRGDIVEVDEATAKQLIADGVAADPNASPEEKRPALFSVAEVTDDELAAHIKKNRLNIDDTIALAGGDAEIATRVLAAESAGGNRSGAIEALTRIGMPGPFVIAEGSDEELLAHIRDEKLSIDDTLTLAGDDPALVARVLAAERSLDEPRAGVLDALEKLTA